MEEKTTLYHVNTNEKIDNLIINNELIIVSINRIVNIQV